MLYRRIPRFGRSALATLLSLGPLAMPGADVVDPMAWSAPASLPAIASTMPEADFQARSAALLAPVDLPALTASSRPATGLKLIAVAPGAQAQRLGLAVGDLLSAIDGHALHFIQDMPAGRNSEAVQTLDVWSASAVLRHVQLEPGRIGISYISVWYPEIGYLHDGPGRSKAWDREMTAAALAVRSDPALTLAALARAQHAGYAGIYLLPLRAL